MRIIAGSARGTPLLAPRGMDTRPTQDKVKESLFNMLQGAWEGGAALDLFAGSGALGLEAVSRGAELAVLVDQSKEAAQCIRRNIEKLRFQDRAELLNCDWKQAVSKLAREGRRFELVFLDPPYRMDDLGRCAASWQKPDFWPPRRSSSGSAAPARKKRCLRPLRSSSSAPTETRKCCFTVTRATRRGKPCEGTLRLSGQL